ncbi:MAG: DUF3006 domain-containing protein [Methanothrix sp.]|nr:DUF3006 domain-containing protein [Methanothrix sp.]
MKAVIDRVEGELAVLLLGDKGEFKLNLPLSHLPEGCKEGDILNMSFERDVVGTEQAKERVSGLMGKLKQKSQGKTGMIKGPGT